MRKTILLSTLVLLFSTMIFSCEKEEDNTKNLPVVETGTISNINFNSAIVIGTVTSEGATAVTKKGIVYGTSPNPVYTETPPNFSDMGGGKGSFNSQITNLESLKTYYVRAYAINANGVGYGVSKSFTTN